MSFWSEVVGQPAAIDVLERAASSAGEADLSHAWLITGPPGSGRSNLALRFAAALVASHPDERDAAYAQVGAGTHPDVNVLTTQKVLIGIDEVREIVTTAYFAPGQSRHRVIVIEDADRMPERTSNVLLKALEEPPERTIWLLCAPSEADLLPTIRSRARSLRLVTPSSADIASLLHERDGIDREVAARAARLTQGHIGMARRLATDSEALARRERSIELALGVATLSDAMAAAAELVKVAQADADALTVELDEAERETALRDLGLEPGAAIPTQLRSQIRTLEEDQKRRATRSLRDGIDRIFTDLLSLYRDMLVTVMGGGLDLVNEEFSERIVETSSQWGALRALAAVSAVETARERLSHAVTPGLVLEALFAQLVAGPRMLGSTAEAADTTRGVRV